MKMDILRHISHADDIHIIVGLRHNNKKKATRAFWV